MNLGYIFPYGLMPIGSMKGVIGNMKFEVCMPRTNININNVVFFSFKVKEL